MKIAVMQPYLFPYIGYFQLISSVDKFVVYDDVHYINKGWINRNNILVNNEKHLFTLPLKKSGQNKLIKDIHIHEPEEWKSKFLRTIETSYKHSEYFKDAFEIISQINESDDVTVSGFNFFCMKIIADYLDIKTEIVESSAYYNNSDLKSQDRILDICNKENADGYFNLPGGADLYSHETFNSKGIDLKFLMPDNFTYRQFDDKFTDSLSIIDVLMFNSKNRVKELLGKYVLS